MSKLHAGTHILAGILVLSMGTRPILVCVNVQVAIFCTFCQFAYTLKIVLHNFEIAELYASLYTVQKFEIAQSTLASNMCIGS